MPGNYQVDISMPQVTVQALQQNGFTLVALHAMQAGFRAVPTAWFCTTGFAPSMQVAWVEQYQAYTSGSMVMPNARISMDSAYNIGLGQQMSVTGPGNMQVSAGGPGNAITLANQTMSQITCGIAVSAPGYSSAPVCAVPLYPGVAQTIMPVPKVLLMFSDAPVGAGTVLEQANGPALLVDLSGSSTRQVSYDVNSGWSCGGQPWGQTYPSGTSLAPLLTQ
jgi:hypothetical protein